MIKQHEFNTKWWGQEVGIVTDPAFFAESLAEQHRQLQPYAWVEFVQPVSKMPARRSLVAAGFFQTDTQIRFRLELSHVKLGECARAMMAQPASSAPFQIKASGLRPFANERFFQIPGATPEKVLERYVVWSNALIAGHPQTCLQLALGGEVQGWFLSHPESGGLELTLAMLSAGSKSSGFDLYSAAISAYAGKGFRLGFAGFSVTNTAVHNIYAALGARFLEPRECWMWLNPTQFPQ